MSPFINSIREPVGAALFDAKVNSEYGSETVGKKYQQSYIKQKDRLPFIPKPEIQKPEDKVAPLSERLTGLSPEKVAQVGVNVFTNLARKNIGGAISAGVQGVAELWTGKSTTAAEAVSANVSVDSSEGGLAAFFSNNELTRPFAFRLKRLTQAIREYMDGQGSGTQLAWEFGKVGLIVGGALAALGVSILTAGGFDGLLQVVSVSASAFSSLTSFSIPTLIQSLTATTPLACSFLSAAHVIADQLMQSEIAKEVKNAKDDEIVELIGNLKGKPEKELQTLETELEKTAEDEFSSHHLIMQKNSLGDVARRAFLTTYHRYWRELCQNDPEAARVAAEKIDYLLKTDIALKRSSDAVWEKLQCWHVLNNVVQAIPADVSSRLKALKELNIKESYKKQLEVGPEQLPFTALIIKETLQEEVEKEIGVKLDRKTGSVLSAATGRQLELSHRDILERIRRYQKRVFLGGYLAEHYTRACDALPQLWSVSEKRTQNVVRRRSAEQMKSLADFLMQKTVEQTAIDNQVEEVSDSNGMLERALADQLLLLKQAANSLTDSKESLIKPKGKEQKQADDAQSGLKGYDLSEEVVVPARKQHNRQSIPEELARLRRSVSWIARSS